MSSGSKSDAAQGARHLVSRLGRVVKQRVREFAAEARQHLHETVGQVHEELDAELGREPTRGETDEQDNEPRNPPRG